MICRALRAPDRECVVYDDGRTLLRDLRRETFDAFVMDWHVPHVSGPEIVQWVRRHASSQTPILFVPVAMPNRTSSTAWRPARTTTWSSPWDAPN
nr:response regulator [Verticiella sp. GG226]